MLDETLSQITALLKQMPRGTAPDWNQETTDFYAAALGYVPDDVLKAAVGRIAQTARFRPMPVDILDICRAIMGDVTTDAATALQRVRQWRNTPGSYGIIDPQRPHLKQPGYNLPPPGHPLEFDAATITVLGAMGGLNEFYEAKAIYSTGQFRAMYLAAAANDDAELAACALDCKAKRQDQIEWAAQQAIDEDYLPQLRVDDHSERLKNLLGDVAKKL